ncbi:MAG: rhomboid family intramembrane serine protease [Omnitrophica WOR_2 bacterium]
MSDSLPPTFPKEQDASQYGSEATPPAAEGRRWVTIKAPSSTAYVTYTIMGFTILVYLFQVASQYILGMDLPALWGIKANHLIVQGQFWRLITPVFLHSNIIDSNRMIVPINILHIAFNMYALYIFGPALERFFKHWRFFFLYMLSGFAGNVVSFILSWNLSLGASTAIFGLLAAEGVFFFQNQKLFAGTARRALTQVITIAVINLAIGMSPGIDNWGHVGGLAGGLLFTWLCGPVLKVEGLAPDLTLQDQREPRETVLATVAVGALFALIVAATIYFRTI